MEKKSTSIPEIWGGIECSYNRVRSKYFDQLAYCNHYDQWESDITLFAKLGIKTMRYPVIWERLQPRVNSRVDWALIEGPLNSLRQHDIKTIVGLVHHGSGPRCTDLTSPEFATQLSKFAGRVAEKFPWINHYTPVNEPLTTARFCGLYGLWFPHKRNDKSFVGMLLNELKGVVLSMAEIRKVNPKASLVQTEDLAKVYSTPFMKYQAVFENHRRWLTYDILCGKLVPGHPLWNYFRHYSASESDLNFFTENPCPPDIIGLDYYPTSERYLDEQVEKYPIEKHGHNRRHHYADVEAIRIRHQEPSGPGLLLKEVWDRYKIPLAITEVHINCDYDNQIRWFGEIRNVCRRLINDGVDIKAITTWAMLGSFGWSQLLTEALGDYESGAFDISGGSTVATPLANYIHRLSVEPDYQHPALLETGWWDEESRFLFERNSPAELASRDHPLIKEHCFER